MVVNALEPWYKRIHLKFTSKPSIDLYKFIYHITLRNPYTGIIIDEPDKCADFIKETILFKNIFYNIQIKTIEEYHNLDIPSKNDLYIVHYFCNEKYYNNLKKIPSIGIYYDTSITNHIQNVPINDGEIIKRLHLKCDSIEDYLINNDYTLFLDTDGNVYDSISFKTKVCNVFTDNIEVKLFSFVLRKKGD